MLGSSEKRNTVTDTPLWQKSNAEELERAQENIQHFRESTPYLENIQAILPQILERDDTFSFESSGLDTWEEIGVFLTHARSALVKLETQAQETIATAHTSQKQPQATGSKTEGTPEITHEGIEKLKHALTPLWNAFDQRRSYSDARYVFNLQKKAEEKLAPKPKPSKSKDEALALSGSQDPQDDATIKEETKREKATYGYQFRGETSDLLSLELDSKGNISKAVLPSPMSSHVNKAERANARDLATGWSGIDPEARSKIIYIPVREFKASNPGHLGSLFAEVLYQLLRMLVESQASAEQKQYAINYVNGFLDAGFDLKNLKLVDADNKPCDPKFTEMVFAAAQGELSSQLDTVSPSLFSKPTFSGLDTKLKEFILKLWGKSDSVKKPSELPSSESAEPMTASPRI